MVTGATETTLDPKDKATYKSTQRIPARPGPPSGLKEKETPVLLKPEYQGAFVSTVYTVP